MGSFRLLLAIAVLISHSGYWFHGASQGVVAVVSFFVISGYVTTALIEKHYNDIAKTPAFLLDRVMRLFPQYLFYLVICIVLIWMGKGEIAPWLSISPQAVAMNALMVPTNFYMLSDWVQPMNPPTWTLGLEFTFYILAPALILWRFRTTSFVLSFVVFLMAFYGVIDTDMYGYRLIAGTLFIFLCGSFMRTSATRTQRILVGAAWIASWGLLGAIVLTSRFDAHYNIEMVVGLIIGIPAVALLSKVRYRRLDEVFGNISYGVYLNHFPIQWALALCGLWTDGWPARILLIVLAFGVSWLTYTCIERPVIRARHRLRRQAQVEVLPVVDVEAS
ncbi:acyltransferase family protein [Dyella soli]|uniref:acyltransferase family protein n=1 Tax=Dyella soli TaxID=522319 RepID=UPI0013F4BBFE|nr:acyltransferase [Dyella soli]